MKRFAGLDGIRAMAALLVVSVHLTDNIVSQRWEWLGGRLGVAAFFVLSGFLITTLALREEQDRGRLSFKAFFLRRSFRIFPLYYYVLGVTAFLDLAAGGGGAASMQEALPYYLTYFGEYAPTARFYHSWSLGVEEKFYILWPVAAFLLLWRNRSWRLPIALAGATIPLVAPFAADDLIYAGYARILMGCSLALALHDQRLYARLARLVEGVPAALPVAAMLVLHAAYTRLEQPDGLWQTAHAASVAWVLLVCVIYQPVWLRFLDSRPMRYIGERSYGIYLVQVLVVPLPMLLLPGNSGSRLMETLIYVVTCALCIWLADVLRRIVEMPFMQMGRKLSDRVLAASERERQPAIA